MNGENGERMEAEFAYVFLNGKNYGFEQTQYA